MWPERVSNPGRHVTIADLNRYTASVLTPRILAWRFGAGRPPAKPKPKPQPNPQPFDYPD